MLKSDSPQTIHFDGQVALVTGAGRGLGAAYARLLASRGASVVVHDAGVTVEGDGFDPSVADGVVQQILSEGGSAAACYENLEDAVACRRVIQFAIDRFGRLDALIHNAGLVIFSELKEMSADVWSRMVNLGVHAPYHLVRAAIPLMQQQRYGRIVLTTSGRALRVSDCVPGLVGYSVGKMAQLGLMVAVAAENQSSGVYINGIRPLPQRGSYGGIGQSYCLTSLLLASRSSRRQHAKILVWFYWRPVVAFRSHNGLIIKA